MRKLSANIFTVGCRLTNAATGSGRRQHHRHQDGDGDHHPDMPGAAATAVSTEVEREHDVEHDDRRMTAENTAFFANPLT